MPYFSQLLSSYFSYHSFKQTNQLLFNLNDNRCRTVCDIALVPEETIHKYLLLSDRKILHQNGVIVGDWRLDIIDIATILSF